MESLERKLLGVRVAESLSQSGMQSAPGRKLHRNQLQMRGSKFGRPVMQRHHHDDVADHHSLNDNEANNHDDSVYFNVNEYHCVHIDAVDNEHAYYNDYYAEAIDYYGYYYAGVDDNYDRKGHNYRFDVDE